MSALDHSLFVLTQGSPGLVAVLASSLGFLIANRAASVRARLASAAPGAAITVVFLVAALGSFWTTFDGAVVPVLCYTGGLLIGLAAIVPAWRAHTTSRWWHSLHLLTLVGTPYLWLIGAMAISHDWL